MEKHEIYSPMEEIALKQIFLLQDALETKRKFTQALELDLMLLEMEAQQDMYEGKELQEWIL